MIRNFFTTAPMPLFTVSALPGPIALVLLVVLSGCAPAGPEPLEIIREDGYKVSVKADGVEQKNFSEERVHRIPVSSDEVAWATRTLPAKITLPFTLQIEKDLRGKASGLRVVSIESASRKPPLGLAKGDILTSVGTSLTRSERDVGRLYEELKRSKQASLTLLRGGKFHKFLYYIEQPS